MSSRIKGHEGDADLIAPQRLSPAFPEDDYFTPEARALCRRVKHKWELTDNETLMLAMAGRVQARA
jgi:hypothetical protein